MDTPIFILGAGGHSKVLIDCLYLNKNTILGILDINQHLHGNTVLGISILGSEDDILKNYSRSEIKLVNGVGSIRLPTLRENIFNKLKRSGFNFLNVIHPTSYIGQAVLLNEGAQVFAGSIIQPGCYIGSNVIINTNASIDHDCYISSHVHLAPGVICCGDVTIGEGTHVGSGAIILQGTHIGDHCLIGAGAVVTKNISPTSKVMGIPARIME
ncbi:MAG TPA: acetyltransferase [Gammaproteobacteria bacterium]|nr:acetyltransferase [Gammaproteobacteria bacterium]